jgi:lysophospholipase L1-like esterase
MSTTPSPEPPSVPSSARRPDAGRARGAGSSMALVGVLLASGFVVTTCGRDKPTPSTPSTSTSAPAPSAPTASAAPAPSETASASASASTSAPTPKGPLDNLKAALTGLEKKTLSRHVRIAWLGDSHGQADFWTGALRDRLTARFGKAGPGFVHLGYKQYRHDGVKLKHDGSWGSRPKNPATSIATDDGIFGLGGATFHSKGGGRTEVSVTDATLGPLSWDLCYRTRDARDALELKLDPGAGSAQKATKQVVKRPASPPATGLVHLTLATDGASPKLGVTPVGGAPELCGVVIETPADKRPGVVLDNLAFNGARVTTALAWNAEAWEAELSRRSPDLVVMQYGTNEASDYGGKAKTYAKTVTDLVARIRKAAPRAECLVVGPTDRADRPETIPTVRDGLRDGAAEAGCVFWDTYEKMGGKGSITEWARAPEPRAAKDGVHLTPRGYRELGDRLASDLLKGMGL